MKTAPILTTTLLSFVALTSPAQVSERSIGPCVAATNLHRATEEGRV
jgi:hypothetical protein